MSDTKTAETPTLATVLAFDELRKAEAKRMADDTRPRKAPFDCSELGTDLKWRRWTIEQCYTIRVRLRGLGQNSNRLSVSDSNRGHAIKIIQIGLIANDVLAFPGEVGFNKIGRLPNSELSRLATEALRFNEVFGHDSIDKN